jgi:excisionase family DNA binding protein
MTSPHQPLLNLALHQRTALVTVETARAALGIDADSVLARIDAGLLRWSWDVSASASPSPSTPSTLREIRLWARELIAPELCADLDPAHAIRLVIGLDRDRLRAVEVAQLLLISRPTIMRLVAAGELQGPRMGHAQLVQRPSLAAFLARRLISQPLVPA